eukprot:Skav231051  [mRNA]  locus=scaffold2842:68085:70664:+ [translate_table: standard]
MTFQDKNPQGVKLLAGGQWQRAVHLWADHLHRNVVIYTATITACTRSNAWAAACQVLSDMEQRRVAGNEFTCSAAISAFQASSKWQEAVHLLEPTSGIFHHLRPNVVIYNGVLSACDVAGQWQRVLGMLGKMCEKALQPDLFSYATVALHNAALGACATGSQWRLVFHSLDRLSTTVQIDEVTYGTALNAAVRGSAWQRTVALFGEMCRSKVPINTIILNTVLSACERGSQWSTALHLLGSHLADATSISLAVAACCAAGHWRRALALNVAAPEVHVAAMKACARGEQWMEMLMWLEALKGHLAALRIFACLGLDSDSEGGQKCRVGVVPFSLVHFFACRVSAPHRTAPRQWFRSHCRLGHNIGATALDSCLAEVARGRTAAGWDGRVGWHMPQVESGQFKDRSCHNLSLHFLGRGVCSYPSTQTIQHPIHPLPSNPSIQPAQHNQCPVAPGPPLPGAEGPCAAQQHHGLGETRGVLATLRRLAGGRPGGDQGKMAGVVGVGVGLRTGVDDVVVS